MKKTCSHKTNFTVSLDCSEVIDCVNTEIGKIITDSDSNLVEFCSAVVRCVDAQLSNITDGESNTLDHFGTALNKILQSFTGYSESGELFLQTVDGTITWTEFEPSTTYLSEGAGITITGTGLSSDPYEISLTAAVFTVENAQDAIGTILSPEFSYNDTTPSISINALALTKITTGLTGVLVGNGSGVTTATITSPLAFGSGALSLGTVGVANGGTALTTYAQGDLIYSSAANTLSKLAKDTNATRYLSNTGTTNNPAWAQINLTNGVTGALPVANGGSGLSALGTPNQLIRVNAGATALEFFTPSFITGNQSITLSGDASGSGTTTIAVTIASNSISNSKLRDSAGFSVIGKSTTGTGDVADITAAADEVLRRSGSGDLLFGTLVTNNFGASQVTFAKIQNINTQRVLGRSTSGSGDVESLTLGTHLKLTSGTLNTYGRTLIGISKFTANGTWTKPTGCNAIIVTAVSAGGGGGGTTGGGSQASAAGAGASGTFTTNYLTSGFSASESVTVGTGGGGGAAGNNNGSTGGSSSFGSLIVVAGGGGGLAMTTGTSPLFALGGSLGLVTTTTGTVLNVGQRAGNSGIRLSGTVAQAGVGTSAYSGGGDNGNITIESDGSLGVGFGGGGNGATSFDATDHAGGNGSNGVIIVYEYS